MLKFIIAPIIALLSSSQLFGQVYSFNVGGLYVESVSRTVTRLPFSESFKTTTTGFGIDVSFYGGVKIENGMLNFSGYIYPIIDSTERQYLTFGIDTIRKVFTEIRAGNLSNHTQYSPYFENTSVQHGIVLYDVPYSQFGDSIFVKLDSITTIELLSKAYVINNHTYETSTSNTSTQSSVIKTLDNPHVYFSISGKIPLKQDSPVPTQVSYHIIDNMLLINFPVPTVNHLSVKLYNILGNTVLSNTVLPGTTQYTLSLSGVRQGVYFLNCSNNMIKVSY
jgi:hypothetical protein